MAAIDSRYNGYMRPLDETSTDTTKSVLIDFVSEVTGLPKDHVRWAWTTRPGSPIPYTEDWCAVGLLKVASSPPYKQGRKGKVEQADSGDAFHITHQTLTVSFSFYGPNAPELSDLFRDGAQLDQNVQTLTAKGLTFQAVRDDVMRLPDLVGQQWRERYTVEMKIGRVVRRRFGVRTIASADVEIFTEKGKI